MQKPPAEMILEGLPKRQGIGHARKLDMLHTTAEMARDLDNCVSDFNLNPEAYDIDEFREEMTHIAFRMVIVMCEGKLDLVASYVKELIDTQREKRKEMGRSGR